LTDERSRENRVAVAERDGELVGTAYCPTSINGSPSGPRHVCRVVV